MRLAQRYLPLTFAAILCAMTISCTSTPRLPTFRLPSFALPTPGALATPSTGDAVAESIPCARSTAATDTPPPLVAQAPEPPVVPGAGQPGEDEYNEGDDPDVVIDPDGVIQADQDLDTPTIYPSGAEGDPTPQDVVSFSPPTALKPAAQVAEPNVASNGSQLLMTWNLGAARSFDGGRTVQYMSPWEAFLGPDGRPVDGGFCCDQLAQYVPGLDLWIWVLQSRTVNPGDSGGNRIRVRVARGGEGFGTYWDFRSSEAGLPGDVWFDQPKIGVSNAHLFLSINAYRPEALRSGFVASVVYRVALADLAGGAATTPQCISTLSLTAPNGSPVFAPVPVRVATDNMYLAAHYSNTQLLVMRWPDAADQPTIHLAANRSADGRLAGFPVPTRTQADGTLVRDVYQCPRRDVADTKSDWCRFSNERITSAWMTPGLIGFAWNVGQDPANGWPYPSVWVWLLDEALLTNCAAGGCVVASPNVRHRDVALQYAAIAPNASGDLGLVVLFGGGDYKPSCWYAARSADAAADAGWDFSKGVFASDIDALEPRWGDYLNITRGTSSESWTASCMTLHLPDRETGATVQVFEFGRREDQL